MPKKNITELPGSDDGADQSHIEPTNLATITGLGEDCQPRYGPLSLLAPIAGGLDSLLLLNSIDLSDTC